MSTTTQPDSSLSGPSSDDASSPRSFPGKVILPRLDGPLLGFSPASKRTAHACERCRALKAKCTGGARCEKCRVDKAECSYGDGKRERNKKEMASQLKKSTSLIQQNEQLLAALMEVTADPAFDAGKHPAVMQLLCQYPDPVSSVNSDIPAGTGRGRERSPTNEGETATAARVGSPGAMDRLAPVVSLGFGSGASGYVGKSSEIAWLQRAHEKLAEQQSDADFIPTDLDSSHPEGSHWDYHVDEANLLAVDEDSVDPMELPPLPIATALAEAYFDTVHDSFPLVTKGVFMDVLIHQFHSHAPFSWARRRWLSTANIIFAIGAKWMYVTRPRSADTQRPIIGPGDHIVYYARARSLGLDHRLIMDHPLIEQIQALAILGLYLIVNHQISRAWTTVGHTIRHAIALGLHLRVGTDGDNSQQQLRSRIWWSLYSLEQLLGDFTGRPTSIVDSDIAIPLGLAYGNELARSPRQRLPTAQDVQQSLLDQSPPGPWGVQYSPHLYFVCRVRLSIIGHKIRTSLYASGKMDDAWSRVQHQMREYAEELAQWSADLPEEMSLPQTVDIGSSDLRDGQLLGPLELAMAYQSTRMVLFRPCLCHLDGVIAGESTASYHFNKEAAISCISAARSLLALLPNEAANTRGSKILPWWSLLHYIVQAGAVLILELCLGTEHMPSQVQPLLEEVGKVMAWLAEMAADSLSAWRCWKIFRTLLNQAAAGVGMEAMIPEELRNATGWEEEYEQLLAENLNANVATTAQCEGPVGGPLHQLAAMSLFPSPSAPFAVDGAMTDDAWNWLPHMPDASEKAVLHGRDAFPPPGGMSAGEGMDWRA